MRDDPVQSDSDGELTTLVRADLDRRADDIDPRQLFARIRRSVNPDAFRAESATSEGGGALTGEASTGGALTGEEDGSSSGRRLPFMRLVGRPSGRGKVSVTRRVFEWTGGLSAAAAAIFVAFFLGSQGSTAQASPEAILRDAQRVHQLPLDRCYLVEVKKQSELLEQSFPMTQQSRVTRLWTRGDRYWIESVNTQQRFAWGRNVNGDLWMALGNKHGLLFGAEEIPPWLRISTEIYSMRVDHLLDEVLRDFDLVRQPSPEGQPLSTILIRATLKPGRMHPALGGATIEFDGETKVVRKLVLERTRRGEPVATVTYLLVDTQQQDPSLYELKGQLDAPYEVFTSSDESKRRQWMNRFFGPMLDMRPPPPGARPMLPRPMRGPGEPADEIGNDPVNRAESATRPATQPATKGNPKKRPIQS